ncbi:hypothetical protein [Azospirillum sp. sgz302134]
MGRPKTRPDTVMVPTRLDKALIAEVDAFTDPKGKTGPTRTQVIEEGLRWWLTREKKRRKAAGEDPQP